MALFISSSASAVIINVSGSDYNIAWSIGTYAEVEASGVLTSQPWWGDASLTRDFTRALGYVDDGDAFDSFGPLFAFGFNFRNELTGYWTNSLGTNSYSARDPDTVRAYAYTARIGSPPEDDSSQVSESGSFVLFALGLVGLGISRRARKRSAS